VVHMSVSEQVAARRAPSIWRNRIEMTGHQWVVYLSLMFLFFTCDGLAKAFGVIWILPAAVASVL
jgi:hypothetical protein